MFSEIAEALAPILVEAIVALVILVWGWVAVWAKRRYGIEIEMINRQALHSALVTGADLVLDASIPWEDKIDRTIAYAKRSAPDAIRGLVKDEGILRQLAEAKLRSMLRAKTAQFVARPEAERTIAP